MVLHFSPILSHLLAAVMWLEVCNETRGGWAPVNRKKIKRQNVRLKVRSLVNVEKQ